VTAPEPQPQQPQPQPQEPELPGGGAWSRLHPATPLLKGGIALVAVIGFILANLRERIIDLFIGGDDAGDIVVELYERGHLGWAILIVLGGLTIGVVAFFLSWRMHTFRISDEAVEVRSGILFRTHRKARLDRIQGIAVTRPFFARIFGAARIEVSVAGQDAKVQLAYLPSRDVDRIRLDILKLASARRAAEAGRTSPLRLAQDGAGAATGAGTANGVGSANGAGLITQRVSELLAPELDPNAAPPESVVKIPPLRLVGSLVLSGFMVFGVLAVAALIVLTAMGRGVGFAFLIVPMLLGGAGYLVSRFTKSLRFSIAGTPDGVRVGYGLLTTSNDTLPPGRIHAIEVYQPLLWRPARWWAIRINRAGHTSSGSGNQPATTTLPVGTVHDVEKVLGLLLPGLAGETTRSLIISGMLGKQGGGFIDAPKRARWLRPVSWKRTGYVETADAVLIRKGFVWRQLVVVPSARIQSIRLNQGPVHRALDLAGLHVHTVAGPVVASLDVIDRVQALAAFHSIAAGAVRAATLEDAAQYEPDDPEATS
jgi:putative membrane protein